MHDQFGCTDSFAGRFQQAARSEGRFEDEDSITPECFRFEDFAGGFAADFFIGSPEKDQAFAKRYFRLLKSSQCEKCLDDSGFHVKGSRAVNFAACYAERHPGEGSGGVDRVVVAQDQ